MSTATLPEANGVAAPVLEDDWTTEVPEPGGNYVPCPAGNHAAVCVGIVALGTHEDTYQGETKTQKKLALIFETPAETDPDGNTFTLAIEFTHSLQEKAKLRGFLETWRGKKFEEGETVSLAVILGKPCLLNVTNGKGKKDKVYANAGAATPLPKGMPIPTATRAVFNYSPGQLASGIEPPADEWLPRLYGETIADKVKDSAEWKKVHGGAAGGNKPGNAAALPTTTAPVNNDSDIPW